MTDWPETAYMRRLREMFDGPSPTMQFEQGFKDARAGRPSLRRDTDYVRGFAAGESTPEHDHTSCESCSI